MLTRVICSDSIVYKVVTSIRFTCCGVQLQLPVECRQDSESVEAQVQLQAEVDRWQLESNKLRTALSEAQAGREQAEEHLERLQGSLQDLQRHSQDRGNLDELQARFKEVNKLPAHCTALVLSPHMISCCCLCRHRMVLIQHCLHAADSKLHVDLCNFACWGRACLCCDASTGARRICPWLPNKHFEGKTPKHQLWSLPVAIQVTELLYTKQTQLERLAAEKAAQQLTHERQLSQAKDDAERVKRWALCIAWILH